MVDHFAAVGGWRFLRPLDDLLYGDIETSMAFDGVPIGISKGLAEQGSYFLGCCRVSGCPGLENAPGAGRNRCRHATLLRRRSVRTCHTPGRLGFSVENRHSLSIPAFCQVFPRGALLYSCRPGNRSSD